MGGRGPDEPHTYSAGNRRDAKRLACRLAAQELDGAAGCWEFDFASERDRSRFIDAYRELIAELERRGRPPAKEPADGGDPVRSS